MKIQKKNLWNYKRLKLKNKVRVKKRKVKFHNLQIIEMYYLHLLWCSDRDNEKLKISEIFKKYTFLGIQTYLWWFSVNKIFPESFFGQIMTCRTSEFTENMFFSLRRLAWLKENFFIDWFYYNLTILIKWCQISFKYLDKAVLFPRNQVFCLKIWKLWRASTTLQVNIFCWNFAHVS